LKVLLWLILGLFFALLVYAESDLPNPADPAGPTRIHITPEYIEGAAEDTHTPNLVTAVLADYRSYDTLGETVVILTAGLAVILILPRGAGRG